MNGERKCWDFVDAVDEDDQQVAQDLEALEFSMKRFYGSIADNQGYWREADRVNQDWTPEKQPCQFDLANRIGFHSRVIDFGCGSAHPSRLLRVKNVRYLGLDISERQIELNRKRYPGDSFQACDITADPGLPAEFNWAICLFAMEHCARPHRLLDQMLKVLKPGGNLAVICPHFSFWMNSLRCGRSADTKRAKLKRWAVLDLLWHILDEKVLWPRRLKMVRATMQLPIYLRPACLNAPYYSDNDAVFLVSPSKLMIKLEELGADPKNIGDGLGLGNHLTYILARKT